MTQTRNKKTKWGEETVHKIKELEQENIILQSLNEYLTNNIPSEEFVNKLKDHLRNPLSPIKAYVDMLIEGQFGNLTEIQKEKLEVIRKNAMNLDNNITEIVSKSDKYDVAQQ